jgi:hypothetical protein
MIYIITGTPIIGVMALIGIIPIETGATLTSEHSRAITAPANMVIGVRILWLEVPRDRRAM